MPEREYEYRGLMARTWDIFRGDTSQWEDRRYYLELIRREGEPALDVGCGTGRLLLDYMQQGIDIDGVDISPEMLDICREKAESLRLVPNLYLQSMPQMGLPRQYRVIIVPSSSFQLVLEPANVAEAMLRFYRHLLPGGVLAMPFLLLWREGDALDTGWNIVGEKANTQDGTVIKKWSRSRYEPDLQIEHTEDRYEISRDGVALHSEHHRRSPATRWYTPEESVWLYKDAGFAEIEVWRGFSDEPATEADNLWTVVGRKGE